MALDVCNAVHGEPLYLSEVGRPRADVGSIGRNPQVGPTGLERCLDRIEMGQHGRAGPRVQVAGCCRVGDGKRG